MKILVTGGAGYIGSHTVVELCKHAHEVAILDNFSNSSPEAITRVREITGRAIVLYEGDVADKDLLRQIFEEEQVEAVIHFAGFKAVGESVERPLTYYRNNVGASTALCEVMQEKHVQKLIFSSSATVYGNADIPYKETSTTGIGIINPYGQTKYMVEQILRDVAKSDPSWAITTLRYFNPIGAHESGRIGEDPLDIPNNLMPYVSQVAVGKREKLHVFGNNYDTPDGTGVRDYIHVVDLAKGHVAALEQLHPSGAMGVFNLGTGKGASVFEVIAAYEKASGITIAYDIVDRRPGDLPIYYADASKASSELGWHAEKSLLEACEDSWRWQSSNPNGYR